MAAFRYEALDAVGRDLRGVIEADTLRQARANLRDSGLSVISVQAVSQDNLQTGGGAVGASVFAQVFLIRNLA